MEELSIYNLTITSDHRLKVNNEEVGGDGSILPGDSESLLAWALVQVGYIQQDSDSNMALQIEDQRPDGYGVQKVTIPPGKRVLIEALRKRTGRDLSYITEEVQQKAEDSSKAEEAGPEEEDPNTEEQWEESWEETPSAATPPPSGEPSEDVWTQPSGDAWTGGEPQADERQDDAPVLAPPPSLVGVPDTPAHVPNPPTRRSRERAYEQPLPEPAQPKTERFPEGWGDFDAPAQDEPAQDEGEDMPPLPQFDPRSGVTEHEDLSSEQVTYKRSRPELGEDEAKAGPKKKPKSKPMIAALVVLSLLVVFLGIQLVRLQGENSYVATCVDERTMVRQASIEGCKNEEASYYRWWYTPRGSEVPAVNQTVAQDQGTRIRPDEATIREDFAAEGGVYGGEEEEG